MDQVDPAEDDVRESLAKAGGRADLAALADTLESAADLSPAAIEALFRAHGEARGLKLGALVAPARLAITGKRVGPGLFESIAALGRARSVGRLRRFAERAGNAPAPS